MKRTIKQTLMFLFLIAISFCLSNKSVFAQRTGFSAATPESLNDPTEIKCKAGTLVFVVQIAPMGFNFLDQKGAQSVVEEVLQAGGYLAKVITAKEAKIGNSEMCRSTDGNNYILYDPSFFTAIYRDTDEQWADRGIFAHELGHFAHNDDLRAEGSNPQIEFEADEYAGEILAKMGATLQQSQAAFRSKRIQVGSHDNHPPTEQRLVAVEKGWRKVNPSTNLQQARAFIDSGNTYYGKKEYDRAIADYTKAIEINPQDAAYNNRGNAYFGKKEYDRAIADYTKAIEINPQDAFAYNNRGRAYYNKKEYDRAITDLTKAIEINPQFAFAYNNRGIAYYYQKEYDRAIADYTKAIEINPQDAFAYYNRGRAYFDKKEYDRAITDLTKAIEINPQFASAYIVRGVIYYYQKEYDRAIADYTKAIEINPQDALVYNNRGRAYFDKKEYDRAITDLTKAIEINPQFARAYKNRGEAYRALGKNDLAKADEEKAKVLKSK